MLTRPFLLSICSLALLPAAGAQGQVQAQFIDLSGVVFNIRDITPDGQTICGVGNGQAYFWRWQQDPAPTFIGGTAGTGISDDGSIVTGNLNDPATGSTVAGIWTQATGWQTLGGLSGTCGYISSSHDISGDGSTVVGLGWNSCSGRGFHWTQTGGMIELEGLVNGNNRASAIAADGSLVVGFAQGNLNRTPAIWQPDATGMVFDPDVVGECRGVSDDGSIVVGEWNGEAFYYDAQGLTLLGSLNPTWAGNASGVAQGGTRICGFDNIGVAREAWVWSPGTGIEQLQGKLTDLGVPGVGPLGWAEAMTPDGVYIAGNTSFAGGWVAILPAEIETYCTSKIASIGCVPAIGFTGIGANAGVPQPFSVTASEVVSQKPGLMFYGFGSAAIPFFGGTLCVQPPLGRTGIQFSAGTPNDCSGTYAFDFNALIQAGINPALVTGADVFAQYWFRDPADLVFGVGLTNGLAFSIM